MSTTPEQKQSVFIRVDAERLNRPVIVGAPANRADDLQAWLEQSTPRATYLRRLEPGEEAEEPRRLLRPYNRPETVARSLRAMAERRWPHQLEEGIYVARDDDERYWDIIHPYAPSCLDDVVGATEIAGRSGVDRDTIEAWRRRHADFPRSRRRVGNRRVWPWPEVEGWLMETGRMPVHGGGRPTPLSKQEDPMWEIEFAADTPYQANMILLEALRDGRYTAREGGRLGYVFTGGWEEVQAVRTELAARGLANYVTKRS